MMITYNHERFIAQAIESVLMQQTSFPIELVVGDDCSKDGTPQIVRHYAALRPDVVRPILHERNVGMAANGKAVRDACRGEFIAILEGDDYWSDPHKLQRQVDWLDAHPKSAMCFHNVEILDDARGKVLQLQCPPEQKSLVTTDDLLIQNPVPTCSVVYRHAALPTQPEQFQKLPMQDWPSWILLSRDGPLGYLNFVGGCYRLHGASAWSSKPMTEQVRRMLLVYDPLSEVLGPKYEKRIQAARKTLQEYLVISLCNDGEWAAAKRAALTYLKMPPRRFRPPPGRSTYYARLLLGLHSKVMLESVQLRTPRKVVE